LKLKHDELLSNFAFNFNLRHYKMVRGLQGGSDQVFQEAYPLLAAVEQSCYEYHDAFRSIEGRA